MAVSCHGECQKDNFKLEHKQPYLFVNSQWPCLPQIVYLLWRLLAAVYFLVWVILSGAWTYDWSSTEANRVKWFIYLTNWMFFTMTVAVCVHLAVVIHAYHKNRKGDHPPSVMPWYYKLTWVLYNLACNIGVTVSLLFWALLYTPDNDLHPVDFNTHAINSVYILLDICVSGVPIRIHHFFHGFLFGLVYLIFSVIYTLPGGTNSWDKEYIYSVLSWKSSPGTAAIYSAASLAGIIVIWIILYALYWIRIAICGAACRSRISSSEQELEKQEPGTDNPALKV